MPRFFWNGNQKPSKFRRRIEHVPEDERALRSYERRFGSEEERAYRKSVECRLQQSPQNRSEDRAQLFQGPKQLRE